MRLVFYFVLQVFMSILLQKEQFFGQVIVKNDKCTYPGGYCTIFCHNILPACHLMDKAGFRKSIIIKWPVKHRDAGRKNNKILCSLNINAQSEY